MNFIYQLVTFIDVNPEPPVGTPIYGGSMGWIPNVAIKRRFAVKGIDETELLAKIRQFCGERLPFEIVFTRAIKPDFMPESIVEIAPAPSLLAFHNDFLQYLGDSIQSKYPEREGTNYRPHMTITWRGERVVNPDDYVTPLPYESTRLIRRLCLVKDTGDENSKVLAYFAIHSNAVEA